MRTVQSIMKSDVIWVKPDDRLDYAYRVMLDCAVRHLPVIDKDELVGLVSEGDILLRSTHTQGIVSVPPMTVDQVMVRDLVTCRPTTRLADVAATMIKCKIDCIPVTQNGQLIGMLTASDIIQAFCEREERISGPATLLDEIRRDHSSATPVRDALLH